MSAYLTLALIAATSSQALSLSAAISRASIAYTASSVAGPIAAGVAMKFAGTDALICQTGFLALFFCGYVVVRRRAFAATHRSTLLCADPAA